MEDRHFQLVKPRVSGQHMVIAGFSSYPGDHRRKPIVVSCRETLIATEIQAIDMALASNMKRIMGAWAVRKILGLGDIFFWRDTCTRFTRQEHPVLSSTFLGSGSSRII